MRAFITVSLLLLLTTAAKAMDPPAVEWEELYGSVFRDVQETDSGDYVVAGRRWYNYARTLFLFSSEGDYIWEASVYPYNHASFAVIQLESGDFVATGYGVSESSSSQYSLSIYKISSEGDALWSKVYEFEDNAKSYGNSLIELPDGGFAVCGRIDPTEGMDQAWILRTDAQGDTLWTREWAYTSWATAVSILFHDNSLLVLAQGNTPTTPGGPHLLKYDMDGNLLWETNFPDWPGTVTPGAEAMCEASDGGLLLMDNYWPTIMHTDYEGNPDWWFWPPGASQPYGYSVSTTMDGGILYGGEQTEIVGNDPLSWGGMISRHDSLGNLLWYDDLTRFSCIKIYSARQLSQGGYIAAGETGAQGFLIKYAPELGFESEESSPSLEISSISPNPFSAVTEIQFSLVEAGYASLTVFDLNGRVVDILGEGVFTEGEHTLQWAPEGIASGCYMIRLTTEHGSVIENMIFIK